MTTNKQQPTMGRGSVTTEQAGEQMPMPDRLRTKGDTMEGLPEAHGRSSKQREPPRKPGHTKAMELGRKTEREASGFGPTALRPLYARDPFSFLFSLLL